MMGVVSLRSFGMDTGEMARDVMMVLFITGIFLADCSSPSDSQLDVSA